MTQEGFSLWWDEKKHTRVQPSFAEEIRLYGLGVKAGNTYEVANIRITGHEIEVSLGDGGLVTKYMQTQDEYDTSAIRQAVRQTQYGRLQSIANGSGAGIYFHKYRFLDRRS